MQRLLNSFFKSSNFLECLNSGFQEKHSRYEQKMVWEALLSEYKSLEDEDV